MSESVLSTAPAKNYTWLVEFMYGENFSQRSLYCRYSDDLVVFGETYASEMGIELTLPKMDGLTEDQKVEITLPPVPPLDACLSGAAHSPVAVAIAELCPGDDTTYRVRYYGWIHEITENPNGRYKLLRLSVRQLKSCFDVPLGIVAGSTCVWQFGDQNCAVTKRINEELVSCHNAGRFVTLDGLVHTTEKYYYRGYVTCNGLSIPVRKHPAGNVLELGFPAPVSWIGAIVTVTPGCDKLLATCKEKWHNEGHFCGVGMAIPAHNPNYEIV